MSESEKGIDRFAIKFKRTMSLPTLPHAATALIRAIDGGEATAADLERIIAADPSLSTMLMRAAAIAFGGNPPTSLRMAILRLGQREIRTVAISLSVKRVLHEDPTCRFDVTRYARHSLTVGFLARYLSARRQQKEPFESKWSADELFAAGVLHDIGLPLLARVAPEDYSRVELLARRTGQSFQFTFTRIFACELGELGALVAKLWELPPVFTETMRDMHAPWRIPKEMVALSSLSYADYLANQFGATLEDWEVANEPILEAEIEVGIDPVEQENLKIVVDRHVTAMMEPVR